jgi:hypothetical protein
MYLETIFIAYLPPPPPGNSHIEVIIAVSLFWSCLVAYQLLLSLYIFLEVTFVIIILSSYILLYLAMCLFQEELYDLILQTSKECLKLCKPGATIQRIHDYSV